MIPNDIDECVCELENLRRAALGICKSTTVYLKNHGRTSVLLHICRNFICK